MVDAPVAVDVHIVPSTEPPTGCGEPPVPVMSPAVVNAFIPLLALELPFAGIVPPIASSLGSLIVFSVGLTSHHSEIAF